MRSSSFEKCKRYRTLSKNTRCDVTSDAVLDLNRTGFLKLNWFQKDVHSLPSFQTPVVHMTTHSTKWRGNRGTDPSERDCGPAERENSRASPATAALWHHKAFPCRPLTPRTSGQKGSTEEAHPPLPGYSWPKTFNPFTDKGWPARPNLTFKLGFHKLIFAEKHFFFLLEICLRTTYTTLVSAELEFPFNFFFFF